MALGEYRDWPLACFGVRDDVSPLRRFDLLRRAAALFGDSPWILTGDVDEINGYPVITYQQVS